MKRSESWKEIPGYENRYVVSDLGRIKSLIKNKIMKQNNIQGYLHVNLYKDSKRKIMKIHRAVMLAFLGKSNLQVNHIDGNKKNNCLENLEYCDASHNMKHSYSLGLRDTHGINNSRSKFTEEEINDIKFRIKKGERNKDIAAIYEVCPSLISHIKRGFTYAKK